MARAGLLAAAAMASIAASKPVLGGYDMVAYYTTNAAVLGARQFAYNFTTDDCNTGSSDSAAATACVPRFANEFWFSSAANAATFQADPWTYAPRWGGF